MWLGDGLLSDISVVLRCHRTPPTGAAAEPPHFPERYFAPRRAPQPALPPRFSRCDHVCFSVFAKGVRYLGANNTRRVRQVTVNEYTPGDGIATHVDTHSAFTDAIALLSLGSTYAMDFTADGRARVSVALPRCSLACMTGEARFEYAHAIARR